MNARLEIIIAIITVMSGLSVAGITAIFANKLFHERRKARMDKVAECFQLGAETVEPRCLLRLLDKWPAVVISQLRNLAQPLLLKSREFSLIIDSIRRQELDKPFIALLTSRRKYLRMKAAAFLSVLPSEAAVEALSRTLQSENDYLVRLYIANALADIGHPSAIPIIIETLPGAPLWYCNKVSMILQAFGKDLHEHLSAFLGRDEVEIKAMVVDFASVYVAEDLMRFLLDNAEDSNRDIAYRSVRALGSLYIDCINSDQFIFNADPVVRNIAIGALSQLSDTVTFQRVLPLITDKESSNHAIAAVSNMARLDPRHIEFLIAEFHDTTDNREKCNALTKVLSNRIEYLLMCLLSNDGLRFHSIIAEIIAAGQINGIIGFMNKNRNIELENEVLPIIRQAMADDPALQREFCLYLRPRLLSKIGYERLEEEPAARNEQREHDKVIFLTFFMVLSLLTVPIAFAVNRGEVLFSLSLLDIFELFALDFTYFVAYYSITINSIYFLLLFFSFLGARKQLKYWRLKSPSFLFKPRMLPSVSIIAPAFREEATIIDSVNSLLNLKYPNYELIVVNDGSPDDTLNRLISYFNLEKVDWVINARLVTKPVRGVYVNKDIPKLVVIDKANGGKADSLNAGINISRKEYFCGIDADSLLEQDALIKIASLSVDSQYEAVALGGNILPVNGCTVKNGMIIERKIAGNFLGRLQTVEYLRAFMAGRLGWAYLKSLLIISGAFGLFRKDRVVDIGGYLTSSERFKKDTVGEDMELVVRLTRTLSEKKIRHKIFYSYNANCWTEVPEDWGVLQRQRDRWQRGLLDIISFHRKLIFNPSYGTIGVIAMPYFLIFEMIGPLMEFQGYIVVILAALLGALNFEAAALLFLGSVLMGIVVSVYSLLIAEQEVSQYSAKEVALLICMAIFENLGIRQIISFWRITGYINSLKKPKGWGQMPRRGFAPVDRQVRAQ